MSLITTAVGQLSWTCFGWAESSANGTPRAVGFHVGIAHNCEPFLETVTSRNLALWLDPDSQIILKYLALSKYCLIDLCRSERFLPTTKTSSRNRANPTISCCTWMLWSPARSRSATVYRAASAVSPLCLSPMPLPLSTRHALFGKWSERTYWELSKSVRASSVMPDNAPQGRILQASFVRLMASPDI